MAERLRIPKGRPTIRKSGSLTDVANEFIGRA
jgi:hypothetical protein